MGWMVGDSARKPGVTVALSLLRAKSGEAAQPAGAQFLPASIIVSRVLERWKKLWPTHACMWYMHKQSKPNQLACRLPCLFRRDGMRDGVGQ